MLKKAIGLLLAASLFAAFVALHFIDRQFEAPEYIVIATAAFTLSSISLRKCGWGYSAIIIWHLIAVAGLLFILMYTADDGEAPLGIVIVLAYLALAFIFEAAILLRLRSMQVLL